MPFFLPKGAEREYLTANGIVAIYVAESDEAVMIGVSRDLYQSLIAVRRHHPYAAIVNAFWVKGESDAGLICDAIGRWFDSKITAAMVANRIECAAEGLNIPLTDHHMVLTRAKLAVEYIDSKLAEAQEAGQLRFFNRAYRQWRLQAAAHGRSMSYAEARARLRRSLYRQFVEGEPIEFNFPALEALEALTA